MGLSAFEDGVEIDSRGSLAANPDEKQADDQIEFA